MEEIYKVIKGHENYSVSNFGNVKNNVTGRILRTPIDAHGYKRFLINGKTFRIHKLVSQAFIPNPNKKKCIDHIDNNKTNNNVSNLRWCSQQENCFNASISKNNTSGHKGISWEKKRNKWVARVSHNGKYHHLGYFDKLEDALKARQEKANKLFGEYVHSSERNVNLNIEIPKNTKLNINIKVKEDDEEYQQLEQEFEKLVK